MADAGLFIGWGAPVRGREERGLDVFQEALALEASLQEEGAIESFEVVLLAPHGGGLAGFVLVRGSREQIAAVREREDVNRLNVRAALIVEEFGVVDAYLNEGLAAQMETYREATAELAAPV
ncbi:MAG: hypothetical protein JST31_09195 [Actinobacteria bacterium]|nr:hypothetical protein [Actinomycetota bacterium]